MELGASMVDLTQAGGREAEENKVINPFEYGTNALGSEQISEKIGSMAPDTSSDGKAKGVLSVYNEGIRV